MRFQATSVCVLICLGFFLLRSSIDDQHKALSGESLKEFREQTLLELNLVRTNPVAYLKKHKIDQSKDCNDGIQESRIKLSPGGEFSKPVRKLKLHNTLNTLAASYAKLLAIWNVFSHTEYGELRQRCDIAGYDGPCGENIAAHSSKAKHPFVSDPKRVAQLFVEQFVLDCMVEGRGHVRNLMHSSWTSVGVGYYWVEDSTYKNYVVHNFGQD